MTEETTTRGPRATYVLNAYGEFVRKLKGVPDEVCLNGDPADPMFRLTCSGYVFHRGRGETHADIISGAALPDWAPPKVRAAKAPRVPKVNKSEMWLRAIALATARQSPDTDTDFGAWVRDLSADQIAVLKKDAAVKVAYRELTGTAPSLVEIAAASTSSLDQAAD